MSQPDICNICDNKGCVVTCHTGWDGCHGSIKHYHGQMNCRTYFFVSILYCSYLWDQVFEPCNEWVLIMGWHRGKTLMFGIKQNKCRLTSDPDPHMKLLITLTYPWKCNMWEPSRTVQRLQHKTACMHSAPYKQQKKKQCFGKKHTLNVTAANEMKPIFLLSIWHFTYVFVPHFHHEHLHLEVQLCNPWPAKVNK